MRLVLVFSFIVLTGANLPAQELRPIERRADRLADPAQGSEISIGYDMLFWSTGRDGLDFVADRGASPPTLIGNLHEVGIDDDSGGRLGIGFNLPGAWRLGIDVVDFDAGGTDAITTAANNMFGTRHHPVNTADRGNGNVGYARGRFEIDYQSFDVLIGAQSPMKFMGGEVFRFYGVRSIDSNHRLETRYANNTVTDITDITDEASIEGIGLFVGADTRFRVNQRFAIMARALGGPAAVTTESRYREVDTDNGITNIDVELSEDEIALFFEISIGGQYLIHRGAGSSVYLEGGYEILGYSGLSGFIDWTGDAGSTRAELSKGDGDFGFDGFYLRLMAQF